MLDIVFISDYVCPYCLVAKENLEQALIDTGLRREAKITFYPLELTPPDQPAVDVWNDETRRARYQALEEPAAALGLGMKLPPHVIPRPHTRLAMEAWLYACDHDRGNLWNACMYHAYFCDEIDIGDPAELKHIAKSILLDAEELGRALEEGRYTQRVLELEQEARDRYQPRHVPTIFVNGKYLKVKEYTKDEMVRLLREAQTQAQQQIAAQDEEPAPGMSCGLDGCK